MAQRIQTLFIDDIDSGAADGTVRFGRDGTDYEIDLSGEHADELRKALGKYIEHSRKGGGTTRPPSTPQRCANGSGRTATKPGTVVASRPTWSRNTRRPPGRNRSHGGQS